MRLITDIAPAAQRWRKWGLQQLARLSVERKNRDLVRMVRYARPAPGVLAIMVSTRFAEILRITAGADPFAWIAVTKGMTFLSVGITDKGVPLLLVPSAPQVGVVSGSLLGLTSPAAFMYTYGSLDVTPPALPPHVSAEMFGDLAEPCMDYFAFGQGATSYRPFDDEEGEAYAWTTTVSGTGTGYFGNPLNLYHGTAVLVRDGEGNPLEASVTTQPFLPTDVTDVYGSMGSAQLLSTDEETFPITTAASPSAYATDDVDLFVTAPCMLPSAPLPTGQYLYLPQGLNGGIDLSWQGRYMVFECIVAWVDSVTYGASAVVHAPGTPPLTAIGDVTQVELAMKARRFVLRANTRATTLEVVSTEQFDTFVARGFAAAGSGDAKVTWLRGNVSNPTSAGAVANGFAGVGLEGTFLPSDLWQRHASLSSPEGEQVSSVYSVSSQHVSVNDYGSWAHARVTATHDNMYADGADPNRLKYQYLDVTGAFSLLTDNLVDDQLPDTLLELVVDGVTVWSETKPDEKWDIRLMSLRGNEHDVLVAGVFKQGGTEEDNHFLVWDGTSATTVPTANPAQATVSYDGRVVVLQGQKVPTGSWIKVYVDGSLIHTQDTNPSVGYQYDESERRVFIFDFSLPAGEQITVLKLTEDTDGVWTAGVSYFVAESLTIPADIETGYYTGAEAGEYTPTIAMTVWAAQSDANRQAQPPTPKSLV